MRRPRPNELTYLYGVAAFSTDQRLEGPLFAIRLLRQTAWLSRPLLAATDVNQEPGRCCRPRMTGSWFLAYCAFLYGETVHVAPWYRHGLGSLVELWRECGFDERPCYQTVIARFDELETCERAVEDAVAALIGHARRHDPLIAQTLHHDATEAAAHARLNHDCQPGEACRRPPGRRGPGLKRLAPDDAAELRHQETEGQIAPDVVTDGRPRIRLAGCWWRTLDPEIGIRAYNAPDGRRTRFWIGRYNLKATCHRTGLRVSERVRPANENEADIYLATHHHITEHLRLPVQTEVFDRGFSISKIYEKAARANRAAVMQLRDQERYAKLDQPRYDRDGVPRCSSCGGPCAVTKTAAHPHPRIWFRCILPARPECLETGRGNRKRAREQSLACSHDFTRLTLLPRLDPAYIELLVSHKHFEHVHADARQRWQVAGKDLNSRPRRRGLGVCQLRATTSILLDWLLASLRCGYLGSARVREIAEADFHELAKRKLDEHAARRQQLGLDLPYGERAAELGIGSARPPSQRDRAGPSVAT